MSVSFKTFLPTGRLSSGVRSVAGSFLHFTKGIGAPTATQVILNDPPSITSINGGGGIEKLGETRRTGRKMHLTIGRINTLPHFIAIIRFNFLI